jgi:murein DD-endopeptidase MepM/ murein hydrolase activator NlpD
MTNLSPHLKRFAFLAIALAAGFSISVPTAAASAPAPYGWPVKPFDQAHPVRANFGDPRTTFHGPPTRRALMTSGGDFSFHFGIDISVPDGTAVYAVRSGTVKLLGGRTVQVTSTDGFATQYWHIVPSVKRGQEAVASVTVLGHVMKGYEHVHFTELAHGRPVNPLAAGHIAPYDDDAAPVIRGIAFRVRETPLELLPESVSGRIVPVANVYDMPALPVAGLWADLPVAPALLTWRIERAKDRRVASPERTALDVRQTIPRNRDFWRYYARGSRQNMCPFAAQRAWRTSGTYLYRLTRTPLDTTRFANGIYRLVVTAADIRGNETSQAQVFIIRNSSRA